MKKDIARGKVSKYVEKWRKKLLLENWQIGWRVARIPKSEKCSADIYGAMTEKLADIHIDARRVTESNLERAVAHELMHLVVAPLFVTGESFVSLLRREARAADVCIDDWADELEELHQDKLEEVVRHLTNAFVGKVEEDTQQDTSKRKKNGKDRGRKRGTKTTANR